MANRRRRRAVTVCLPNLGRKLAAHPLNEKAPEWREKWRELRTMASPSLSFNSVRFPMTWKQASSSDEPSTCISVRDSRFASFSVIVHKRLAKVSSLAFTFQNRIHLGNERICLLCRLSPGLLAARRVGRGPFHCRQAETTELSETECRDLSLLHVD